MGKFRAFSVGVLALALGTQAFAQEVKWIELAHSYKGESHIGSAFRVKNIQFSTMCQKVDRECEKNCALNDCRVTIDPSADFTRSLTFNDDGTFSSFIAIPGEKLSQTTGMRAFSLLPKRQSTPKLGRLANGDVVIELVSGHQLTFSAQTGELISNTIGELDLSAPIDLHHQGSFEVKKLKDSSSILMDHGWRRGESPRVPQGNRKTKIFDSQGKMCEIKNSEILFEDRTNPRNPETGYRFEGKDTELQAWLKTRCSNLNWTFEGVLPQGENSKVFPGAQSKTPEASARPQGSSGADSTSVR